jgi:hypothetical protein
LGITWGGLVGDRGHRKGQLPRAGGPPGGAGSPRTRFFFAKVPSYISEGTKTGLQAPRANRYHSSYARGLHPRYVNWGMGIGDERLFVPFVSSPPSFLPACPPCSGVYTGLGRPPACRLAGVHGLIRALGFLKFPWPNSLTCPWAKKRIPASQPSFLTELLPRQLSSAAFLKSQFLN